MNLIFFPISLIDAKDVMIITGRKPRAARSLIAKIRKRYRKKKGQFITVRELAEFTGIAMSDIESHMAN